MAEIGQGNIRPEDQIRTGYAAAPPELGWGTVIPSAIPRHMGGEGRSAGLDINKPVPINVILNSGVSDQAEEKLSGINPAKVHARPGIDPVDVYREALKALDNEKIGSGAEVLNLNAAAGPQVLGVTQASAPASPPPVVAAPVVPVPAIPASPVPSVLVRFSGSLFGELAIKYKQVFKYEKLLVLLSEEESYRPPKGDPRSGELIPFTVGIGDKTFECFNPGIAFPLQEYNLFVTVLLIGE